MSYPTDLSMSGRNTAGPIAVSSRVYPSGAALATAMAATEPPPPALFSTMTGWPSAIVRSCAIARPTKSMIAPGANETTSVIGRVGQSSAAAGRGAAASIAATAMRNDRFAKRHLGQDRRYAHR